MSSWWTDAIDSGDVDALAELISSGADLHAQDDEGNTALHAAAQGELACAAKLLELGANVNAQNGVGTTALIEAVKYGDCEQVKALLAAGADAALADDEGDAHAHAAAGGDAEIVAALKGEEVAAPASPTGPATKKGRRNSVSSESPRRSARGSRVTTSTRTSCRHTSARWASASSSRASSKSPSRTSPTIW